MKVLLKGYTTLAIAISILVFAACGGKNETEQPAEEINNSEEANTIELTDEQFATAGIELGLTENKQISGNIKANGQLDVPPQQMVSVSAPLGGFLKNTPLLQGSRVKKGQVVATIENLDFIQLEQDYLEAKSQFEFAKADYERQQELGKDNVNSQKVLQQAKTTYTSWQAKFNGLREKLRVMNIDIASLEGGRMSSTIELYSPINGYVTEVNVNIGKFVNPADVLFEIVDTEHLHAELTVFEKDVPRLKIGQKVRFTLANETTERTAVIFLLGREIGADRTIRIHCHIDKEDVNLLPGMYLKAIIETGGLEVPALPDQAIIDFQGKKYIFFQQQVTKGHKFTMLEIQVGNSELGFTEVKLPADFPAGSQVVTKNAYSILSKMKNSEEEE